MVKAIPETDCKGCCWENEIEQSYKIGRYQLKSGKFKFVINHSIQPKVFGHIVVMVDEHRENTDISELSEDEYNEFLSIVGIIVRILRNSVGAISGHQVENVYLMTFNESPEWHAHIHIVPRSLNVNDSNRGSKI